MQIWDPPYYLGNYWSKVKLKTQLDVVKYLLRVYKIFPLGGFHAVLGPLM